MAYRDFDLESVREKLGVTLREADHLFATIPEVAPTPILRQHLDEWTSVALSVNSDQSRSEMLICPILLDVVRLTQKRFSLFVGSTFDVDRGQGLNGEIDYLMANPVSHWSITRPVAAMVVSAKRENMTAGLGECIAELVAARRFNSREEGPASDRIYGVVTTGNIWKFIKLEGNTATIDMSEYYPDQLAKILGIFVHVILAVPS